MTRQDKTRQDLINSLKSTLKYLKQEDIPDTIDLLYQVDEGGYSDEYQKSSSFGIGIDFVDDPDLLTNPSVLISFSLQPE